MQELNAEAGEGGMARGEVDLELGSHWRAQEDDEIGQVLPPPRAISGETFPRFFLPTLGGPLTLSIPWAPAH